MVSNKEIPIHGDNNHYILNDRVFKYGQTSPLSPEEARLIRQYHDLWSKLTYIIPNVYLGGHSWLSLVENQGEIGCCVVCSLAECLKYVNILHASQPEAYIRLKNDEGSGYVQNNGLYISPAFELAQNRCLMLQNGWSLDQWKKHVDGENHGQALDPNSNVNMPAPNDIGQCTRIGFQEIIPVFQKNTPSAEKVELLKEALKKHEVPISVGVPTSVDGKPIDMTPSTSPNPSGWHAITLFGFDDKKSEFHYKNSWGRDWNDGGLGVYPYAYMEYAKEAWLGKGPKKVNP